MRYQNMSENLPITRLLFQKKKLADFIQNFGFRTSNLSSIRTFNFTQNFELSSKLRTQNSEHEA